MSGHLTRLRFIPIILSVLLPLVIVSCKKASGGKKTPEWSEISQARIATGLSRPTHITHSGDGSNRLYVSEQRGRIISLEDGTAVSPPFLDISGRVSCCGERGLLGIAFPPDYKSKKYFYVNYTDSNGDTVVARFRVDDVSAAADPESEEVILRIKQPYSNHNGGQIAFGPDGYLYIGMGDGGSGGDPQGHGQSPASLLGKILRIDVESGKSPYAVPADNPFVGEKEYRPEIWALGLRNPWRFSFDRKTGDLYIGDVGQNRFEEIDFQPASSRGGENYGWNIMEGGHCYRSTGCDTSGLELPVAEYTHSDGCSVTGGFVYRGAEFPKLDGTYFFGDYCSGDIWGIKRTREGWINTRLVDNGFIITTFGEDENGELYFADYDEGTVYRIEAR